jgi:hypothetical protein
MATTTQAANESAATQRTETTFFVFETRDGGHTWKFAGKQDARDRDHAERLYYADLTETVDFVFVSEVAWKPGHLEIEKIPKPKRSALAMPNIDGQPTLVEVEPLAVEA